MADVILLQAAIYVAVDMLPIPERRELQKRCIRMYLEIFSVEKPFWRPCALSGELILFSAVNRFCSILHCWKNIYKKCHEKKFVRIIQEF